jgi:hypothetical protein
LNLSDASLPLPWRAADRALIASFAIATMDDDSLLDETKHITERARPRCAAATIRSHKLDIVA